MNLESLCRRDAARAGCLAIQAPMNRIECDECEENITPMIGETDMGVCAAPTLPEGECTTYGLYPAVEPAALHHQH